MSADDELTRLQQQVAQAEAIEAIKALKYRYWRACDGKDPATFRECFIRSGAHIDYGRLGSFDDAEPMTEIFRRVALHTVDGAYVIFDMHHGMHPEIALTGATTAVGKWSLRFRQVNLLNRTESVSAGEYADEYVVEDGAWRMSVCRFTERWSMTRPLGAEVLVTPGEFDVAPGPAGEEAG